MKIPKNHDECNALIAEMGKTDAQLARIKADADEAMAAAKAKAEAEAAPHAARREALAGAVQAYCEEHRDELLDGKAKSAEFPAGKVSWRKLKDKVAYLRDDEPRLIAALRKKGLEALVRVAESINQQAILAAPDSIKGLRGIAIEEGGEAFEVKPFAPGITTTRD